MQQPFLPDFPELPSDSLNLPVYSVVVNVCFVGSESHKSGLLFQLCQSYAFFSVSKFIPERCKLNLKFSLRGCGSSRENFKDQLEPVNGFYPCDFCQIVGLNRLQWIVKENFFRARFLYKRSQFFYFSGAYLIACVSCSELLYFCDNSVSGGFCEVFKFF